MVSLWGASTPNTSVLSWTILSFLSLKENLGELFSMSEDTGFSR